MKYKINVLTIVTTLLSVIATIVIITNTLPKNNGNKRIHGMNEGFEVIPFRVAIATMVMDQPDFKRWLDYHLDTVKVDKIYLRIEDSPQIVELAKMYAPRVEYVDVSLQSEQRKNNYFTIMDRQKEFINNSLEKATADGISILFHVDADEFIKIRNPAKTIQSIFNQVPDNVGCVHFKNFEAVYEPGSKRCFKAKGFMDCKNQPCTSYANGKSAAVIRNNPKFHGPHYFTGDVYEMPETDAMILHFDSCTFDSWKKKFSRMNPDKKLEDIPFPFYRDSIKLLAQNTNQKDLQNFYEASKLGSKSTGIITMEHFHSF